MTSEAIVEGTITANLHSNGMVDDIHSAVRAVWPQGCGISINTEHRSDKLTISVDTDDEYKAAGIAWEIGDVVARLHEVEGGVTHIRVHIHSTSVNEDDWGSYDSATGLDEQRPAPVFYSIDIVDRSTEEIVGLVEGEEVDRASIRIDAAEMFGTDAARKWSRK